MLWNIAGFLVCSVLIFYHGKKLAHYGDLISLKTGLGRAWIGLILMASVTSLPEMAIGISSVTVVTSADLAVGNVLGSCIFNLAVLSLLDAIIPGQPILARVSSSHVLAATLGSVLFGIAGIGLFLSNEIMIFGWIGITSLCFLIVYFISMKILYVSGRRDHAVRETDKTEDVSHIRLSSIIKWYSAHAVMVILAAMVLPYFSDQIALHTGIGETFVGTLLLAASSSLPEIAVSISAARGGNADMAAGNLFGSNLFNIMLLAVSDMFYANDGILHDASESNMATVFSVLIMNSIAIAGLAVRPQKKGLYILAWDTALILIIYFLAMVFIYLNP